MNQIIQQFFRSGTFLIVILAAALCLSCNDTNIQTKADSTNINTVAPDAALPEDTTTAMDSTTLKNAVPDSAKRKKVRFHPEPGHTLETPGNQ